MTAQLSQIVRGPLAMSLPLPASMQRTGEQPTPIATPIPATTNEGAEHHG